jgi:RNA polymerase sigma-70 factor (ECF subfamily)
MQLSPHPPTEASRAALEDALRSPKIRATLLRAAGRRIGNRADAEDCVQEACVVAFLHVEQLREPEHVRSWLTSIVVNASRMRVRADHGKRRIRSVAIDVNDLRRVGDPSPAIDDRLHARQVLSDIRARAMRHDVRDVRVIDALVDDDAEYDTLARRCSMTKSAFKTRVSRLRKRLKKAGLDHAA